MLFLLLSPRYCCVRMNSLNDATSAGVTGPSVLAMSKSARETLARSSQNENVMMVFIGHTIGGGKEQFQRSVQFETAMGIGRSARQLLCNGDSRCMPCSEI